MIYPQVTREQLHGSRHYTLWLTDMIQMHLTPEQYESLKFSMDRIAIIEAPATPEERDQLLKSLGRT